MKSPSLVSSLIRNLDAPLTEIATQATSRKANNCRMITAVFEEKILFFGNFILKKYINFWCVVGKRNLYRGVTQKLLRWISIPEGR